jgi:transposase-like protein/IS1 family transposase
LNCHCCSGPTKRFGHFQNKNRIVQRYRCTRCGKTFSQSQPLGHLRVDDTKAVQIIALLCEGVGVRASARLAGCHPRTVLAVLEVFGENCAAFLDQRLRNLKVESLQIDELWARVAKRQKATEFMDRQRGDFYTFLAIDAKHKLILAHHTDKRDAVATYEFVEDLAGRIVGPVQLTTDGWDKYPAAIQQHIEQAHYAVMQKIYGKDYSDLSAQRRYSPPACIGLKVIVKSGQPDPALISTSHIERVNLSVRTFNRRFTRLSLGWSKKLANHRHSIAIFVAAYNFCKVHRTLGTTPAVASGLTDHVWSVGELFEQCGRQQP